MASEITRDELRVRAVRAGLELSEAELDQLMPGVKRAYNQADDLRKLVTNADEPAAVFAPARSQRE
jgi:hypothetical protein